MNPILQRLLLSNIGIVRNGLVAEYRLDEGSGQVLRDYSGNGNDGQLGVVPVPDTNDPTWTGQGLSFSTDDYVKLPYIMINAEQDFTIYLVANIGASNPSGIEVPISFGNSGNSIPNLRLQRETNGSLSLILTNDAGTSVSCFTSSPIVGVRLFKIFRRGSVLYLKDVVAELVYQVNVPANPITFNLISLGCRVIGVTVDRYSNQPEYFASFYNRATSDAEDAQILRYIKQKLVKRGVSV
jgi:hypothetical protein